MMAENYQSRNVNRGSVILNGVIYAHPELLDMHGDHVLVKLKGKTLEVCDQWMNTICLASASHATYRRREAIEIFWSPYFKGKVEREFMATKGEINAIAKRHHKWVDEMGWHNKTVLENLALVASEVGEAVNECRGAEPTAKFGEELADIVLRVMDLAVSQGVDLEDEILKKMAKNNANGTRGRKF